MISFRLDGFELQLSTSDRWLTVTSDPTFDKFKDKIYRVVAQPNSLLTIHVSSVILLLYFENLVER